MLGISLPEFLIIACVVLVLVKPGDLPVIAKYYKLLLNKVSFLKKELYKLYDLAHNALLGNEANEGSSKNYVRGNDGKMYEVFDIDEHKERGIKSKISKKYKDKSKKQIDTSVKSNRRLSSRTGSSRT